MLIAWQGFILIKNLLLKAMGTENGEWTYGKAELKEFEITPELAIEELG